MDNGLANPDWKLEFGRTYLVNIQVKGSNAQAKATFKLEYVSNDFRDFQLHEVPDHGKGWLTASAAASARQRAEADDQTPAPLAWRNQRG